MDFISAVIAVEKHPDLEICPNDDERAGLYSICVHRKSGEFVGKLRWPMYGGGKLLIPAQVDPEVEEILEQGEVHART